MERMLGPMMPKTSFSSLVEMMSTEQVEDFTDEIIWGEVQVGWKEFRTAAFSEEIDKVLWSNTSSNGSDFISKEMKEILTFRDGHLKTGWDWRT